MRRELWETMVELLEALQTPEASKQGLRINRVLLDLPIELQVLQAESGMQLFADLPRWRWVGGLDAPVGRMRIDISV